ncbi:16S rRNA (guanine(527)-N(7))-methyltransferase RsmG [Leadbettera azotonutricia]|nr:16S rRNA (guanine(527)-N(7))-methyltransferase RsmG [Leadbettera azotonutricia]
MNRKLEEGIEALGLSRDFLPLLYKYLEEIELFNPAYGLVKVKDQDELVVKHLLDSLAPAGIISKLAEKNRNTPKPNGTSSAPLIADAGSGAGLPGIPLAICLPNVQFTLIERMGRRAGFLRDAIAVLGLSNVTVEEAEMEKAEPARFDIIVFRAFRPLELPILKGLFHLLKPGGVLAAYKGRQQAVEEEMTGAEKLMPALAGNWESIPLEVPFLEEERRLVVMRA